MEVLKRDGSTEPVKLDKITARIKKQTYDLNQDYVDYMEVVKKSISGLHDGITTTELDNLAAETAASLSSSHPDYSFLASRIALTRLYKSLVKPFSKNAKRIYEDGFISEEVYEVIKNNARKINSMIVGDRDFNIDYFGFKTLERSYLLKNILGILYYFGNHLKYVCPKRRRSRRNRLDWCDGLLLQRSIEF